ncbi:hypothetical protein J1614_012195 [Plenodomus biglobosus]|nr:hypothetical protein J1614_012195 [Plenodomus biglobosus]
MDFVAYANTQFGGAAQTADITQAVVQRFKTDNGGEYVNYTFQKFFSPRGIVHDLVPPYHHEVNGVAERWNHAVMQLARAIIHLDDLLRL